MTLVSIDASTYAAALLFGVEPTDRALIGWGPATQIAERVLTHEARRQALREGLGLVEQQPVMRGLVR